MQHRLRAEVLRTSPGPGAPPRACRENQATQAAQQSGTLAKSPPRPPVQGLGLRNPLLLVPTSVVQKGRSPRQDAAVPKTGQGRRPTPNRGAPSLARRNSWGCEPAFPVYSVSSLCLPNTRQRLSCGHFPRPAWGVRQVQYMCRDGFCAVLDVPDFCRFDNQYASRGADGLVAWPASREAKVRHPLHRTSLAILPFPGLQVPWLPSSEWCRWGCGGRTRSGTARRRLAAGWRAGAGGGRRWN